MQCAHQFMQLVREELLGTRVFVFTERGSTTRILNLARGATLADAAALLETSLQATSPDLRPISPPLASSPPLVFPDVG